jgi:hypothetical protein
MFSSICPCLSLADIDSFYLFITFISYLIPTCIFILYFVFIVLASFIFFVLYYIL